MRSGSRLVFVDVQSSKVALPFYIPPAMNESSCCYTFSPACGVVSVLDFWHSNRCMQIYLVVWICISCWHIMWSIFSYAYVPSVHLLVRCPDLLLILSWVICYWFLSVLCIVWMPVLYLCFAKLFSQFVACLFIFLTVFHKATFFNCNKI